MCVFACFMFACRSNVSRAGGNTPRTPRSRVLRGLMLRDLALLLVNRLKKNTFSRECALQMAPTRSIFSPKCTKYRLAAGLRSDPLGELTALPRPLAGFKGRTSKGREESE